MLVPRAAITEGRAETLRLERLQPPMEVEEAELVLDQHRQVRGGVEAANVQRVPLRTLQQSTAAVVEGAVQPPQVLDWLVAALAVVAAHRQVREVVFGPVTGVLAVLRVVVSHPQIIHPVVEMVARVLGRHPGLLSVVVVVLALPVVPVLHLLLAGCLGKVVVAVVVVVLALGVLAVMAVAALAAVAVAQHAVHTPLALVA